MFFAFLLFIFTTSSPIFSLLSPQNIIISDNETVILDLNDYNINGNLQYSIINDHPENFNIRLTDTFKRKKNIDLNLSSTPNSVKFYEFSQIYLLLFDDFLEIVELDNNPDFPKDFEILPFLPEFFGNMSFRCFDSENFIDNPRIFIIDCNVFLNQSETSEIFEEIVIFFELSIGNNLIKFLNYQILSNFINNFYYPDLSYYPRKLKISKATNEIYRYTPFSQINDSNITNYLEIYSIFSEEPSINLILTLPQSNLEDIDFFNENPLLLGIYSGLNILNGTLKTMKATFRLPFAIESAKLRVSYQQIEHNGNRLIVLTNRVVFYFILLEKSLSLTYNYQLNIDELLDFSNFDLLLQLPDYLLITYPNKINVLSISEDLNPNDPQEALEFQYSFPNSNISGFSIKCGKDCDGSNIFSLFLTNYEKSSLSFMEITQRKLFITSMNTDDISEFYSTKRFNFTLSMQGVGDIIFTIIYMKFEDKNLYFHSDDQNSVANVNFHDLSRSLYIMDTEKIFIRNRDFLMGALKEVSIVNQKNTRSLHIDDFSSYKLVIQGFSYLQLIEKMGYLAIVSSPKSIRMLYQSNTNNSLCMASCLWNTNDIINECTITKFLGVQKPLRSSFRYKAFLMFQVEGLEFIYYSRTSLRNENIAVKKINNIVCKSIFVDQPTDLLLCKNNGETAVFLEVFGLISNFNSEEELMVQKYRGKNIVVWDLNNHINVYTDLLKDSKCLMILNGTRLNFYELALSWDSDGNTSAILLPRSAFFFEENRNFSFQLFKKNNILINFLVIYPEFNEILEYSLFDPFSPLFIRKYPVYHYRLRGEMFINNFHFFCIKAFDVMSLQQVLLIYNTTEPSSNILKKRLPISENITSYYNIYNMGYDIYEELNFSDVTHITNKNYPVLLVLENNVPYVRIYKKYNVVGDLSKEIQNKSPNSNTEFLLFELDLQYKNPFISYLIMLKIEIKVLLTDSMIRTSLNSKNIISRTKHLLYENKLKKLLQFNISNQNFIGPIENYRFNLINSSQSKLSVKFQSFLSYNREFPTVVDEKQKNQTQKAEVYLQSFAKDKNLYLLTNASVYVIDLETFENKSRFLIPEGSVCSEIRIVNDQIMVYCQDSFEIIILKMNETKDFELKLMKIINFAFSFSYYLAVIESPPKYLIFLADEPKNNSKHQTRSLIFFTFPCSENNFTFKYLGKISEDKPSNLFICQVKDFQIILVRELSKIYTYAAMLLISPLKFYYLKLVIYSTENINYVDVLQFTEIDILSPLNFTQYQYYMEFQFFNLRILASSIENTDIDISHMYFRANITVLVTSSLHTFLYEIRIPQNIKSEETQIFLLKVFRKFYSCQNTAKNRPKVFKNYMGMFCRRVTDGDEYQVNTYSYFLLYKMDNGSNLENYPLTALPIYLENYNMVFYEMMNKDLLIIPCFLSLFTQYEISPNLKFEVSGDVFNLDANFEVVAYNSFSEDSVFVHVKTNDDENAGSSPFLIIFMSISCLVLCIGISAVLWVFISRKLKKMKKETQEKEDDLWHRGIVRADANLMVFLKGKRKKKKVNKHFLFESNSTANTTNNSSRNNMIIKDYF